MNILCIAIHLTFLLLRLWSERTTNIFIGVLIVLLPLGFVPLQHFSLTFLLCVAMTCIQRPNFYYEQLFDIKNDPGELNDLFNSTNPVHRAKLEDMRKRFLELKMLAHSDMSIVL